MTGKCHRIVESVIFSLSFNIGGLVFQKNYCHYLEVVVLERMVRVEHS